MFCHFRYKDTIQNLMRCNGSKMGIERLQEAMNKWEQLCVEQIKQKTQAELTIAFWEKSAKVVESLKTPERRLIRDSQSHPIYLQNSSIFTSHSFILLSDAFVHVCGSSYTLHPLSTLWVELLSDSNNLQVHGFTASREPME